VELSTCSLSIFVFFAAFFAIFEFLVFLAIWLRPSMQFVSVDCLIEMKVQNPAAAQLSERIGLEAVLGAVTSTRQAPPAAPFPHAP
jgi:hypothetical protein